MHYLQSQRETQHRKVGRTRQLPVPRSKALSTPPKLRDKPTLQTPKISWTTASRERQHELLSRRCATGAPPDGLEHSVHTSRTKESGELFRVEVSRDLVPSQSILGVVGQDDRSRPGRGIYTIALKTYEQISQGYFKSEEAIFESMRGAVGRLWASWVQGYVLKLEYVAGTIFEQTYGSSSHSTPPYPSISGAPGGRKRATSCAKDDRSEDGKSRDADGGDERRDDKRDDKRAGAGAKKQKRSEDQRRMACPYFKHDPVKYNRSVCCGPGFLGVHRVKEHVYRRHSTPRHSCFRCKSTFKTEAELYDHQISETPCAVVSKTTEEEGCTEEQQRLLKARTKYTTTATEADKWRHMYSVLFPGVGVVPSPYYDDGLEQDNSHVQEAEKCAEHLRRELPSQLQQELEEQFEKEFGLVEEAMKSRLAGIVESVSQRIFETWRDHTMKDTTSGSVEVASGTDSTRASTVVGCQEGSQITEDETMFSSTAFDFLAEQEASSIPRSVATTTSSPIELSDTLEFHLFHPEDFNSQIDDKFFEGLLGPGSGLHLGIEPGSCDSAYGSF